MSSMNQNLIMQDGRVFLRPIALADAESLHPIYCEADTMAYYRRPTSATLDDSRKLVSQMIAGLDAGTGFRWVVCPAWQMQVVGSIGYHGWDREKKFAYLSYEVIPAHRGRHWAAQAGTLVLDFGRREMGLARVFAVIDSTNVASLRTAERLGFVLGQAAHRELSNAQEDRIVMVNRFADVATPVVDPASGART